MTTRSRTRGSSRLVSANGPYRLVASMSSCPAALVSRRSVTRPAQLTSTSTGSATSAAAARTLSRSARSSGIERAGPGSCAHTAWARSALRAGRMSRAPAREAASAASLPIPLVAPVMSHVRPL